MPTIVEYSDQKPPTNRLPPPHHFAVAGERLLFLRHGGAWGAQRTRGGCTIPALSAVRLCRPGDSPRDPGHDAGEQPARVAGRAFVRNVPE